MSHSSPQPADEPADEPANPHSSSADADASGDGAATFDALAEVLAGPDGDLDQGRQAARRLLDLDEHTDPGGVPRPVESDSSGPTVIQWLRDALDEAEHRAQPSSADLEPYTWLGDTLGWVPESRPATARVAAERALLDLHHQPHPCPGTTTITHEPACPVVLQLAHARRFDTEGWQPQWIPPPAP